jgi:mannose/fructose/N-acetylgalactosamine-specific phosphotransferase system component IIB
VSVIFTRMDERLVHGQIVVAWRAAVDYGMIGVADDAAAADAFERDLLAEADPEAAVDVLPVAEAAAWYRETAPGRRLVLVRDPAALRGLIRAGAVFSEANLGNRYHRAGSRKFTDYLFLTPDDIKALAEVAAAGVRLTAQEVPFGAAVDVNRALAEGRLDFDHLSSGHP